MPRVVLYAEGAAEALGSITQLPPVGQVLPEDALGTAHVLVRRALVETWSIAPPTVRFDAPQRTRGRFARGSDFLHEQRLRQLLTWVSPEQQPDLAIVLVDADGAQQRATQLRAVVGSLRVPVVVGAPVQEFEAWLLADEQALRNALGGVVVSDAVADPERLSPSEAKHRLAKWIAAHAQVEARLLRRTMAETCSLETLRSRCKSFQGFLADLRALKPSPP